MKQTFGSSWLSRWAVPLLCLLILLLMPLILSDFRLNQLGRFLALAIVALGLDLIWGYGGMLSLGQGLFFGLGAYGFAMFLKLQAGGGKLPDFMFWSGLTELPWFWAPFSSPVFAVAAALAIPALLAGILGYLCLSQPGAGRLLLDHHPGADAADQHLVCRPAGVHRRHQRHHQLWRGEAVWAGRAEQADAAGLLRGDRRGADPRLCGEPLAGGHALWPGARGDPRRREPRALSRLQPCEYQGHRLCALRRRRRPGRDAVRAAGRHHLALDDGRGAVDRVCHLCGAGRPGHAAGGDRRHAAGELRPQLLQRDVPRSLGLLPRLSLYRLCPVLSRRASSAPLRTRGTGAARGGQRRPPSRRQAGRWLAVLGRAQVSPLP